MRKTRNRKQNQTQAQHQTGNQMQGNSKCKHKENSEARLEKGTKTQRPLQPEKQIQRQTYNAPKPQGNPKPKLEERRVTILPWCKNPRPAIDVPHLITLTFNSLIAKLVLFQAHTPVFTTQMWLHVPSLHKHRQGKPLLYLPVAGGGACGGIHLEPCNTTGPQGSS